MLKKKIIPIVVAAFLIGFPCGISSLAEEASTESVGEKADEIGEAVNAQMARVKDQMEQVKEKIKAVKGQKENIKKAMEKVKEEMKKHKFDFSEMAECFSEMAMEIPEIVMEIPEIVMAIPPIPPIHLPKMPNMPHIPGVSSSLKDFKGETVSKNFDKTFETNEKTRLIAHGPFALLVIVPAESGQSLRADVELIAGAPDKEEAQKLLDEMEVSFESKDDALTITAPPMRDHRKNDNQTMKACKVKLIVPALASIELKNQFGDVQIESVSTNIHCENEFGSLTIKETKGNVDAKNKFGSMKISNHIGDGQLRSEFGGADIDGWTGKLELDVQFGQSDISGLTKEAVLQGKFSFGAVNLKLPKDYAGEIEASANMGSIKAPEGLKEKKEMMSQSVSGAIGEGKGRISLKCSFSEVTIAKN